MALGTLFCLGLDLAALPASPLERVFRLLAFGVKLMDATRHEACSIRVDL